jgi:ectoine hydroxylase-related dioxygenase (phytanoyl-CoA dioxygenase family)
MKDRQNSSKVFLHQDYCYHIGFPLKCRLFIPLFKCGNDEGSLTFYPGTHQYSYLGDAGEIDRSKFYPWKSITSALEPGDIVVRNSCLWHESGLNITNTDRVLFDIIIQPSNDPSSKELISGKWNTDLRIDRNSPNFLVDSLFINSRSKKLKQNQ